MTKLLVSVRGGLNSAPLRVMVVCLCFSHNQVKSLTYFYSEMQAEMIN